ncbi:hypothetical protein EYF80_039655 [Liparis tanakae]|uniref:Uncharacterized protein n=1 Tax=Liparis tanakae TaxID=230148 RepID=A0A4Z2G9D6_9TELE|nr:hypothetical protein EYF80_039655 [Liparis tanakae]
MRPVASSRIFSWALEPLYWTTLSPEWLLANCKEKRCTRSKEAPARQLRRTRTPSLKERTAFWMIL